MKTDAATLLDARGLKCPLPVLKARKRLAGMAPGDRLLLQTTDPLATVDIPAFVQDDGHTLVDSTAEAGWHRFLIERGTR